MTMFVDKCFMVLTMCATVVNKPEHVKNESWRKHTHIRTHTKWMCISILSNDSPRTSSHKCMRCSWPRLLSDRLDDVSDSYECARTWPRLLAQRVCMSIFLNIVDQMRNSELLLMKKLYPEHCWGYYRLTVPFSQLSGLKYMQEVLN